MTASARRTGAALGLLCGLLAWPWVPWAQDVESDGDTPVDAAPELPDEPPGALEPELDEPDEIFYVDDQDVIRTRAELGLALRDLGYQRKRTRNGREIYVNEVPWKPQVVVDDDGWMVVRRAPPSFGKPDLPGIWDGPLGYLVCVANPTACVHIGGWVISERKLAWHKEAVVTHTVPTMDRYEDALVDRAFHHRTGQEIPEGLILLWEQGIPLEGDVILETHAQRRAALVTFWESRNCNTWGRAARTVARDFMQYEVQDSDHPFTVAEIDAANGNPHCQEPLEVHVFED